MPVSSDSFVIEYVNIVSIFKGDSDIIDIQQTNLGLWKMNI